MCLAQPLHHPVLSPATPAAAAPAPPSSLPPQQHSTPRPVAACPQAKARTSDAVRSLLQLGAKTAVLLTLGPDGSSVVGEQVIPAELVQASTTALLRGGGHAGRAGASIWALGGVGGRGGRHLELGRLRGVPDEWTYRRLADQRSPACCLQVGDVLRVVPGATVPADGVVESGSSAVNESMLTGGQAPNNPPLGTRLGTQLPAPHMLCCTNPGGSSLGGHLLALGASAPASHRLPACRGEPAGQQVKGRRRDRRHGQRQWHDAHPGEEGGGQQLPQSCACPCWCPPPVCTRAGLWLSWPSCALGNTPPQVLAGMRAPHAAAARCRRRPREWAPTPCWPASCAWWRPRRPTSRPSRQGTARARWAAVACQRRDRRPWRCPAPARPSFCPLL